jgi:NDP-sugar pyrophosphorylase family protein
MLAAYLRHVAASPWAAFADQPPWHITHDCEALTAVVADALAGVADWLVVERIAVHRSATVEAAAVIKPPAVIGPRCLVAHGAYLRGGVWLDEECIVGPGAELKSSLMFRGSKLAHLNFVGDSIVGAGANLEAGSVVANYRNERSDKRIRVRLGSELVTLEIHKFGALIGDDCRIGANAVVAPGALVRPGSVLPRLTLLDQEARA